MFGKLKQALFGSGRSSTLTARETAEVAPETTLPSAHDAAAPEATTPEPAASEPAPPWQPSHLVTRFALDGEGVAFAAENARFEYLVVGEPRTLSPGLYRVQAQGSVSAGACVLGLLDQNASSWLVTFHVPRSGAREGELVLTQETSVQPIVSAANQAGPDVVECRLDALSITRTGDLAAAASEQARRVADAQERQWRRETLPTLLLDRLDRAVASEAESAFRTYRIQQAPEIGYAARSVVAVDRGPAGFHVLVANAGDDTVSVLRRDGQGRLAPIGDLQFPRHSTPIDIRTLDGPGGPDLGVCLFHMEEVKTDFGTGFGVLGFEQALRAAETGEPVTIDRLRVLHARDGVWGARNAVFVDGAEAGSWLAVVDRDQSAVWIFHREAGARDWPQAGEIVPLEPGFDPVGLSGCLAPATRRPVFYAAARLKPLLAVVAVPASSSTGAAIVQTVDMGGLSRSSVAIGAFESKDVREVAVGLWGGDPRELNTPFKGQVFHARMQDDGRLTDPGVFDAGPNSTDVVAGDLDGDGLDELAVLNYGAGLNIEERTALGGVQIFKKTNGSFRLAEAVDLPSPRIGLIADFDGDGRPELGATLFFEKRLAIVKHVGDPARDAAPPLLCFVHVQKTAGTSVTELLRRNFPQGFHQYLVVGRKDQDGRGKNFDSADEDIQDILRHIADPSHGLELITGHVPYGIHKKIGRRVSYFAFLRDPLARALSQYYHVMDETRNSALRRIMIEYDFDFRRAIESGAALQFNNDQTRMLIGSDKMFLDESDLDQAKAVIERDYLLVGTHERLRESLDLLCDKLNLRTRNLSTLNLGRRDLPPPAPGVEEAFVAANDLDGRLYDWVAQEYLPTMLGAS
jgi:sulfotransferase famil protein